MSLWPDCINELEGTSADFAWLLGSMKEQSISVWLSDVTPLEMMK